MSKGSRRLRVPESAEGERLDRWIAARLDSISRSQVTRLLADGRVTVNGEPASKAGQKLGGGEWVELELPESAPAEPVAEPIPLEILYQDEETLVINKPAGLVVHPAPGHPDGTLVNALLGSGLVDDPDQPARPGIVHRLDRETSGLLIVGRHPEARRFLQKQFHDREVEKHYLALVLGIPESERGTIEGPIGRHPTHRRRRAVVPEGRAAITHFETVERLDDVTLLRLRPVTGRTHQIRVHLEAIGLPVAGDTLYGPRRRRVPGLDRQFLHAERLEIALPSGERREFVAPLPDDLERVLADLRREPRVGDDAP